MAKLTAQSQSFYGLPQPTVTKIQDPIPAKRDPTTSDTGYAIGQLWINKLTGTYFGLSANSGGSATWSILGNITSTFTNITSGTYSTTGASKVTWASGNVFTGTGAGANIGFTFTPKGAGGLTLTTGDLTLTAGDLVMTLGDATLTNGDLTLTSGDINVTSGNETLTNGDLTLTAGDINITLGNETLTSGNLTLTAGDLLLSNGDATMTSGNLLLSSGNATLTAGDVILTNGDVSLGTAGNGLIVKSGANARVGQTTLVGGTKAVANTSVTANTRIFITRSSNGASTALGNLEAVPAAGVGFTINSYDDALVGLQANDVSVIDWFLVESA